MKHYINRFAATAVSAVMAAISLGAFPAYAESDTSAPETVTIHFDLSGEGVTVAEDADGNPQTIEDIVSKPNSSNRLPSPKLEKDGLTFSGWTNDGIHGYTPNSVFWAYEEDITLVPVWSDPEDSNYHTVSYEATLGDLVFDTSKDLKPVQYRKGEFVNVSLIKYVDPEMKYAQVGWTYDGMEFQSQENVIMNDKDILFTPTWHTFYKLSYTAGDVDNLLGGGQMSYDKLELTKTDLGAADKFSRIGYKITGWSCDYDGKTYLPLSMFEMPSQDVTMTAVWEPIPYVIVFDPGTKKDSERIKIPGPTGTTITCPDINVEKTGYYFDGWSYEGVIYQPGDDFYVEGAPAGKGISLSAVWVAGSKPTEPSSDITATCYGDATGDDQVLMNDVVLIMQALANKDVYGIGGSDENALTDKGLANADCYNPGDGLTVKDAQSVQKLLLDLISELPEVPEISE